MDAAGSSAMGFEVSRETLAAKFETIFPHLDERQRRLLMGAEARAFGHGGIRLGAPAAGGWGGAGAGGGGGVGGGAGGGGGGVEWGGGAEPRGRIRGVGGGRKRAADLDPSLRPALLALV